jgi:hypothetical protein
LCVALLRPVEENNQLVDDGFSARFWRHVGGNQPLVDAKRRVGAMGGLERAIGLPATCQLQSIAKPLSVDANAVSSERMAVGAGASWPE